LAINSASDSFFLVPEAFGSGFAGAVSVDFADVVGSTDVVSFAGASSVGFAGVFSVDFAGAFSVDFTGVFSVDFAGVFLVGVAGVSSISFAAAISSLLGWGGLTLSELSEEVSLSTIGRAACARVRTIVPPPADLVSDFFESCTVFFGVLTEVPAAGGKEDDELLVDSAAEFCRAASSATLRASSSILASSAILRTSSLLARSAFTFACSSSNRFIFLFHASFCRSCSFFSS
jgi:hypothetical protein